MRVYVHGNCQAPVIASMISDQFPDWQVSSYEVFNTSIIAEIDRYHELVEAADIIISQPIQDKYREREDLSLSWVRAAAKPGAALVVFPSMHFDGQLAGWRSVPITGYGMPYHDMLLFHLTTTELSAEQIVALLLDENLYSETFVLQEIALAIAEMRRREAAHKIDVPLSPFLDEHGRQTQLFHIINHPCRPALAYITNGALGHLGYPGNVPSDGRRYLPFPRVPLAPAVARHVQKLHPAGWQAEDREQFHLIKETLTRAEYYLRAVTTLRQQPSENVMACLKSAHAVPFLARLATAHPELPGIAMWQRPTAPAKASVPA